MQGRIMNNTLSTTLPDFPYGPDGFPRNNWMNGIPVIDSLTIGELILPGAHNAGVDKKADYGVPGVSHWVACQNHSFYYQLINGARAFDLRLEYEVDTRGVDTFWFQHNGFRSSRSLENLIMSLIRFLQENPDEFIVLDFHELNDGNRPFNHKRFSSFIQNHLGNRIIPKANHYLSLGELKKTSPFQRVFLAAEYHPDIDRTCFSYKIEHKWSGSNLTSAEQLNAYISQVMKYPPSGSLPWSLSATSYDALGGPVDIKEYLDQWFDSVTSDWVHNCSIVNVDFFEESNIVANCRAANIYKANAREQS